jgi:ankyrin repeat protein
VQLLLEAGADVAYEREGGYNVLIDAMHSRSMTEKEPLLPLIELLLEHGTPTQGESDWGESALSVSSHIGRFDVVERLLEAGADAQLLRWTQLMHAVAPGSLADVERLLDNGADPTARDRWERTPFLLSLQTGDLDKAKLQLAAGADINEVGNCGQTALMHAIENEHVEVLSWLIAQGADVEAQDEFGGTALMKASAEGATECVRRLLEAGANPGQTDRTETSIERMKAILREINADNGLDMDPDILDFSKLSGEAAIAKAANLDIVRLLVAAGEDLNDISDEMRAELTGLQTDGEVVCTAEEYAAGKHRRFGTANREVMHDPFWKAMVRSGATAYAVRARFGDTFGSYNGEKDQGEDDDSYEDDSHENDGHEDDTGDTDDESNEPVWCFHRFGKSITELPDGRIIEIGGEHEDSYDPDFQIYNDVFVHHGGGRFDILGYPEAVFPPTDFHSATLVGNQIYIIGCLGYPEARRSGHTPVYRLDCETLAIEAVKTKGDKPGWICRHKAVYDASDPQTPVIRISGGEVCKRRFLGQEEYVDNADTYVLNLATMHWSRITD